jgi:endonuclease YncB( thermonuclease family)
MKTFRLWVVVMSWHDGDTFHGILDQGFWTYKGTERKPVRHRCALIACPELNEPDGIGATKYAEEIAPPGEYECISYKPDPDNFGRPLVDLVLREGDLFSGRMLASGHAKLYKP